MSWASERSTSRTEDTAYSLMGLFNVFMPMLYGEGDRAFIRLQEEIMKQSEDYTIFAWKAAGHESNQRGLLARSPSEFVGLARSRNKIPSSPQVILHYKAAARQFHSPAAITSRGILIGLPLLRKNIIRDDAAELYKVALSRDKDFTRSRYLRGSDNGSKLRAGTYLALICRVDSGSGQGSEILCIWLRKHVDSGIFTRLAPGTVTLLPDKRATDFRMHTIYVLPSGTVDHYDEE